MVIKRNGEWEVVVTGSQNPARMPDSVQDKMEGARVVGFGDIPPNRRVNQGDSDWRYERTKQNGEPDPTTHHHAEQRGLRAVDCDDDAKGVAYIAPTRDCCAGCSKAINTPAESGWGGDKSNVTPGRLK